MHYVPPSLDPLLPDLPPGRDSPQGDGNGHSNRQTKPRNDGGRNDVWDQLDDHEALEVQQHQSRFASTPLFETRSNPLVVLGSMVENTVQRAHQAADRTYQQVAQFSQQQQLQQIQAQHQHQHQHPRSLQQAQQHQQQQDSTGRRDRRRSQYPMEKLRRTNQNSHLPRPVLPYGPSLRSSARTPSSQNEHHSARQYRYDLPYLSLPTMDENDENENDTVAASHASIGQHDRANANLSDSLLPSSFLPTWSHMVLDGATTDETHRASTQPGQLPGTRTHSRTSNRGASGTKRSTFLQVPSFPQRPQNDGWEAVPNVDLFLSQLYNYYYHRGLVPILCKGLLEIVTMSITLLLSVVLLAHVNWHQVWQCRDENTCQADVKDYLIWTPSVMDAVTQPGSYSLAYGLWYYVVIPAYVTVFGTYTLFTAWQFWQQTNHAKMARYVLEDKLGFASRKLLGGAIAWEDIVAQLVRVQESGTFRFMINYGTSNASSPSHSPTASMMHNESMRNGYANGDGGTKSAATLSAENEGNARSHLSIQTDIESGARAERHETRPTSPQPHLQDDSGTMRGSSNLAMSPSALTAAETAASILRERHDKSCAPLRASQSTTSSPSSSSSSAPTVPAPSSSSLQHTPPTCSLDALQVAQRIMRKDNFLLAMWNQGDRLIDCTVGGRVYFGATLEWSLHFCILSFMFNHQYKIRPAFVQDHVALQHRFRLVAWLHIVFMPFVLLFQVMHFSLQNVYEFQRNKTYLGHKDWSRAAKLTFREFNELPHVFDARIEQSYEAAEEYFGLFGSSEVVSAIGHLLVFVGGATGGVLLVLATMNDALLLHVQYAGRNLVWYAGMAGIVYSVGKSLSPTKKPPMVSRNLYGDMDKALHNVAMHTHYYPDVWRNRGWDSPVYSAVSKLMDSKVKLLLYELASVVLAPYILLYKWSPAAERICKFCQSVTHRLPGNGAGDVCGYSTFNFDMYGDEKWHGRTMEGHEKAGTGRSSVSQASVLGESNLGDSILQESGVGLSSMCNGDGSYESEGGPPKARHGKMEKSFFSFQRAHPKWECHNPGGQSLLLQVEEQQKAEHAAALAREQQLHIQAAERQLQILTMLEQQQQQQQQEEEEEGR